MSNQSDASPPSFTPVKFRARKDGWTSDKQVAFVGALASTACVAKAAQAVGMSRRSAYDLYHRADAGSLRIAWGAALDQGCNRLADALLSRAIHGTATPVFYKGEQVGERVHYDNRLGMWTLQRRMPERYGAWRDAHIFCRDHADGGAGIYAHMLRALVKDLIADEVGRARPNPVPVTTERYLADPAEAEAEAVATEKLREMRRRSESDTWAQRMALIERGEIDPHDPDSYAAWKDRRAARTGPPSGEPDPSCNGACKL